MNSRRAIHRELAGAPPLGQPVAGLRSLAARCALRSRILSVLVVALGAAAPLAATAAPGPAKGGQTSKASEASKASPSTPAKPTTTVTKAKSPAEIAQRDKEFKLRVGAAGKLCRDCHAEFQKTIAKPFLHTPVKQDDCSGCHNPHASDHGKLLARSSATLCSGCHDVTPKDAKAVHDPIKEKGCPACHDPHASAFPGGLLKAQRALCAECHKAVDQAATKATRRHKPLEEGCTKECHDPHSSKEEVGLLRQDAQALCLRCHDAKTPAFNKAHQSFPVATAKCIGCHDPHGSSQRGMLYDDVHKPVAQGNCTDCHEAPVAGQPVKMRHAGTDLCRSCHKEVMEKMSEQSHLHGAMLGANACLNCHAPHAAAAGKLVKGRLLEVCGGCHSDTVARQLRSPSKHKALSEGDCAKCHDPHSSNNALALKKDGILMCADCHEWQKHSSHPIGVKFKDPRNPNLTMDCLSCHRAHGTDFKQLMPAATTSLLCTQCHAKYKE